MSCLDEVQTSPTVESRFTKDSEGLEDCETASLALSVPDSFLSLPSPMIESLEPSFQTASCSSFASFKALPDRREKSGLYICIYFSQFVS